MESLDYYATKYGTDKKSTKHNYVKTYQDIFESVRLKPIKLMEIGVYLGRSHNMWCDYFPNAIIYGIDIADHRSRFKRDRLILDVVDQGNVKDLSSYANLRGPWDYIIDDGSHKTPHQLISFKSLWSYVLPGGRYFIEDTHFSYWPEYSGDFSLMGYFFELVTKISEIPKESHPYVGIEYRMTKGKLDEIQSTIEAITFRPGMIEVKKYEKINSEL